MSTPAVVYGIDADTSGFAWCCLEQQSRRLMYEGHVERRSGTKGLVATYALDLEHFIKRAAGGAVFLEDIFCQSRKGYRSLAHVQGEILYEAYSRAHWVEKSIVLCMASTWQGWIFKQVPKALLTACNDTKAKAFVCARELVTGAVLSSEHAADAACIAWYGAALLAGDMEGHK